MGAYVGLGWPILEHLGVMLGSSWLQLGPLGPILALSWAILGSLGAHLGSSWALLGTTNHTSARELRSNEPGQQDVSQVRALRLQIIGSLFFA